jgi:extracellular elastinolytic metalloproteinase
VREAMNPRRRLPDRRRRSLLPTLTTAALVATLVPAGATAAPASPAQPPGQADKHKAGPFATGEHVHNDVDNRRGRIKPNARQHRLAVAQTGTGTTVRWNNLGTPQALSAIDGPLATGLPTDPEAAARQYLVDNHELFGLDAEAVAAMDRLLVAPIGAGHVVTLRQRFGDLPAGYDGLVSIAVQNGTVLNVSSSLSRDTSAPRPVTITAEQAYEIALADAGLTADQVTSHEINLVAVPTPEDGPRAAWEVTLISDDADHPAAYSTFVDGLDRQVLVREDLVDYLTPDNPTWSVFPANPPTSGADTRVTWCLITAPDCARTVSDPVTGQAWDVDIATGQPTYTSRGNAANTVVAWGGGTANVPATTSPSRDYVYTFTDQWHQARCNPEVFQSLQRNDADAAISNLFAMHNRMHNWSYHLGFTEATWNMQAVNVTGAGLGNDAEQGRAQQGAISGNRNNANQATPRDGSPPTTNMYLWQPVAGGPYPPCVDGDYDMTVIGHEYTHAISNRMIAGPNSGISGHQGGAMGESWSDLLAAEYLYQNGLRAAGNTPYVTGAYVTGNNISGIRNYDFSNSPLNYSDVGYATGGPAVHADGEIWSAANFRVRSAFMARYGVGTSAQQLDCAEGRLPVDACPGNRRWSQLVFDSFLLQAASSVSMLDMRDNMLAADRLRFDGANADIIWNAFAASGMGRDAATNGSADTDPTPSFASPYARNATVKLEPKGDAKDAVIRLYVGDYEARAVPIADTDPNTPLPDTFEIVPGVEFNFLAVGEGFGHTRFTAQFKEGKKNGQVHIEKLDPHLYRNLASISSGAVISGDGVNLDRIADDTEATNWASLDGVAGRQITVALPGTKAHQVKRVNVSAMLRPGIAGDADNVATQNGLSALRSFAILACNAEKADCTVDANFKRVYTSASDAFPGGAYRPYTRDINLRSFDIPNTKATHLRLEVLTSQCTGGPAYAGQQHDDPRTRTDCATASPARDEVRIAEFQVFKK